MIKSILIPTDGSPNSKTALEYVIYLATEFNAEITGLNVVDIRALEGPFFSDISGSLGFIPYHNYLPKYQQILEERADTIIDAFKKVCEGKGLHPKTKRHTGIVSNIIADEAKKVDLVIIAQRGEHAQWSSGLMGSTTESVVRKSPRPVLVTPQQFRPFNKALLAYDGSAGSDKAIKLACEFVFAMKISLKVIVVNNDEERGREISAEAEAFIGPYHLESEVVLLRGEAHEEIIHFAKKNAIDLIIMGAFGHSRIRELLIGGTTAYIMRTSNIPVLLSR